MNTDKEIFYSVVVPVYNEEEILPSIIKRIEGALVALNKGYEIIFVNDGSTDASWQIITGHHQKNSCIKGINFSRNFGHQVAIFAGLEVARGKMIAMMDGDGQDPPELLPEFFNKCEGGFDVVYGVRKKRKEGLVKKMAYFMFYRILKNIAAFEIPLDAGDFSVISRKNADLVVSLKEQNPFVRGLRCWGGGKSIGIEYERPAREKGEPKYRFKSLAKLAMSGFISFSKLPLRISIFIGIGISILSFAFSFLNVLRYLFFKVPFSGFATIVVIVSFLGGVQLIILGMIGEYIGAIFDEIKNRPRYIVEGTLGIEKNK